MKIYLVIFNQRYGTEICPRHYFVFSSEQQALECIATYEKAMVGTTYEAFDYAGAHMRILNLDEGFGEK